MIDISKYEKNIINNIEGENIKKILSFLVSNNCDYIEELLENYLDLFTIEYDEFVFRFNKLNKKYNYNLINEIRDNTNIIEEFFY